MKIGWYGCYGYKHVNVQLNKNMRLKRVLRSAPLVFILLVVATLLLVQPPSSLVRAYFYFNPEKDIFCYWKNETSIPDVTSVTPEYGSIFFHETSCHSYLQDKLTIGRRQACAIESAAKMNPHKTVYLLYASPGEFKFQNTESDRMLQQLLSYDNIQIYHVDVENYLKDTPVEHLYRVLKYSRFPQSHTSDVLRYLTLWRYGGIYLDLDVVVLRSFEDLAPNCAGAESERNVAAGVISLDSKGVGRRFAEDCINDLKESFNGNDWGWNGPGVISRLSKRLCQQNTFEHIPENCEGFKVYPKSAFYPVKWEDWYKYFDAKYMEEIKQLTENSYVIHVWNKHSADSKIPLDSDAPYLTYAREFCPKVVKECDRFF